MPDLTPVDVVRTTRGGGPHGGGCLLFVGVLFLAAGAGLAVLVTADPEKARAPMAVIYAVCASFSLAGLFTFIGGLQASLRRARRARVRRERPHEPWHADHDWNPRGDRERPIRKALGGLLGMGFFALFLAPFNWWLVTAPSAVVVIVVGLFDLVLAAVFGFWLYELARAAKYGASSIHFDRFPFFLGERLEVRVGCRRRLDRFDKIVVMLRFLEESRVRSGKNTQTRTRQVWAERLEFDPRTLHGVHELPVSLELPTGPDYATRLSDDNARYWEIEMTGEAPGIDFQAQFLVPVYGR